MARATILIAAIVLGLCQGRSFATECSENAIHQETVACYNQCIQIMDMNRRQQCTQQCVDNQNAERASCPNIRCKIVAGFKICE